MNSVWKIPKISNSDSSKENYETKQTEGVASTGQPIADPSSSEPSTSYPSTSNPSTKDPSTTDPSTTDPSTTDPSTTDPSTTDPSKDVALTEPST
jgi:hypothetical protein